MCQQEAAEEEMSSRRTSGARTEDQTRPWTLPKGNFSHPAQGDYEKPWECASRELKAETGIEWTECRSAAVHVDVPRSDNPVTMERFFLWRDDSLTTPESGEASGEKQWKWFSFEDAAKKSATAKAIVGSVQCQGMMKT